MTYSVCMFMGVHYIRELYIDIRKLSGLCLLSMLLYLVHYSLYLVMNPQPYMDLTLLCSEIAYYAFYCSTFAPIMLDFTMLPHSQLCY